MARRGHMDARSGSSHDDLTAHCIDLGGGRHVELEQVLGRGGSAAVYRALLGTANGLRRPVAVKLFSALASDDDQMLGSLLRVARRLSSVDHPNIAAVYECGVWRCQPFLVTELVDGVSLRTLQDVFAARQRRVPLDVALFIACEIGEALAGARLARDHHGVQLGLVHHNVSASEVLLSWRGEVKVTDFETTTARSATSSVRSLRGLATRATAMAPEVAMGHLGDARSDVFSFGVLLRELLVGPRFPAGLANADAVRLAREGYIQPLTFQPHLPEGLLAVVERALSLDPEARYPNACAMANDLRRVALAMGVGDGRYFLRSTLRHEWSTYDEDVTAERFNLLTGSLEEDAAYGGDVVPLNRRR